MSNKLIIKNDLIEVQTLPDNKLIFLISDDNDGRYRLSNLKKQISSLIYDIKYDIKEGKKRIKTYKKHLSDLNKRQKNKRRRIIDSIINNETKKNELEQKIIGLERQKQQISLDKDNSPWYLLENKNKEIQKINQKLDLLLKENNFLARILARLSTLQRKLRYINELSFFNRWTEKFKTEQINDFHFNFKNKYINEKMYRKSNKYIKGRADIETKSFSFEELIKEMEKYKIPYHKYFIINELLNNLKINELNIDIFNSRYGTKFVDSKNEIVDFKNDILKIRTLTISDKLSSLIKNFMEINKIESHFLSDYVKFLEWLFSDINFDDNRDYDEKLTDYTHFVWDLMSNAKKI